VPKLTARQVWWVRLHRAQRGGSDRLSDATHRRIVHDMLVLAASPEHGVESPEFQALLSQMGERLGVGPMPGFPATDVSCW
jgi:hypothetical protein